MNKEELAARIFFIEGTPPVTRVVSENRNRRELPEVEFSPEHEASAFDDFYEFDEDLSDFEAARSQIEKIKEMQLNDLKIEESSGGNNEIPMENKPISEDESRLGDNDSFLTFEEEVLEEILEDEPPAQEEDFEDAIFFVEDETISDHPIDNPPASFKQCIRIKDDGNQCKRQAPKKSEFCSSHR